MSIRKHGAPLFGTVTDDPGYGGIARVSRLAQTALEAIFGEELHVVRLLPSGGAKATWPRRALFASRISVKGRLNPWTLFDHAGIARAAAGRYGLFLHGIEAWNPDLRHYARAIRRASLRIAVSQHTATRVREAHGLDGRIDVIPLALLPEKPSGRVDEGLLDRIRPLSVGIVARLAEAERHKGHDELILCFREVLRRVPAAQLVIVGDGEDRRRLEGVVADCEISRAVLFTGRVSEATLARLYDKLAVFAMPSRAEGFGLVYLEAMRKGLPCIASVHDAAKEVVANRETGILVDHTDPATLVGPITSLLEDPELRRRMGEKGRDRAAKVFSYERFEANLRGVLSSHALL